MTTAALDYFERLAWGPAFVAKVVHGEYVPRFGTPVGPDGFFVPATREGSVSTARS